MTRLCPGCSESPEDCRCEWEECWACSGEGGHHDCGEDTCCCLDPEGPPFRLCEECDGVGRIRLGSGE